jgi:hypothetical protein
MWVPYQLMPFQRYYQVITSWYCPSKGIYFMVIDRCLILLLFSVCRSSRSGYRGILDPDLLLVYNRQLFASSRDYTSITDQLEVRLPRSPARPGRLLPAIRVEASTLMDAEEADYNLFENLIERRLRSAFWAC